MTGQEAHARWLSARWPDMNDEQITRAWETGSDRLRAAWEAVAQPHQALAGAIADLAGQVTASARATEPSRKSQIEHELAIALRKLLEDQ